MTSCPPQLVARGVDGQLISASRACVAISFVEQIKRGAPPVGTVTHPSALHQACSATCWVLGHRVVGFCVVTSAALAK